MTNHKAASLLAIPQTLATILTMQGDRKLKFYHKERVRSGIGKHSPKLGRNRPAKGYDPVTKTWMKH
jgi:hypothetical protein